MAYSAPLTTSAGGAVVVQSMGERDGKRLHDRQVHLFHVENGQVREIWQFVGHAAEAFWS